MQVTPPFFHIFLFHIFLSHSDLPIFIRDKLPVRARVRVEPSKFLRLTILHLSAYRALRAKYSVPRGSLVLVSPLHFLTLAIKFCYLHMSKVVCPTFFSIFNFCTF